MERRPDCSEQARQQGDCQENAHDHERHQPADGQATIPGPIVLPERCPAEIEEYHGKVLAQRDLDEQAAIAVGLEHQKNERAGEHQRRQRSLQRDASHLSAGRRREGLSPYEQPLVLPQLEQT